MLQLTSCIVSTLSQVLAWAEHYTKDKRSSATVSNQPPHLPCPPSSPTTPPSSVTTPFQPRPQPYVPQRSSNRLHPPPGPSLTPWEREFIAKNKDDVHDLLLVSSVYEIPTRFVLGMTCLFVLLSFTSLLVCYSCSARLYHIY